MEIMSSTLSDRANRLMSQLKASREALALSDSGVSDSSVSAMQRVVGNIQAISETVDPAIRMRSFDAVLQTMASLMPALESDGVTRLDELKTQFGLNNTDGVMSVMDRLRQLSTRAGRGHSVMGYKSAISGDSEALSEERIQELYALLAAIMDGGIEDFDELANVMMIVAILGPRMPTVKLADIKLALQELARQLAPLQGSPEELRSMMAVIESMTSNIGGSDIDIDSLVRDTFTVDTMDPGSAHDPALADISETFDIDGVDPLMDDLADDDAPGVEAPKDVSLEHARMLSLQALKKSDADDASQMAVSASYASIASSSSFGDSSSGGGSDDERRGLIKDLQALGFDVLSDERKESVLSRILDFFNELLTDSLTDVGGEILAES